MRKYSLLSTYIVVLIILCIRSITITNAIVGNICTSASIKELNKTITTGVNVKVKEKEWIPGSKILVKVDVGNKKSIRNIIIWAETVDGMHIGYWSPISFHDYVSGCNGPANSTITNQIDLNLSQMTYEWNSPNAQDYEPSETSVTPTTTSTYNSNSTSTVPYAVTHTKNHSSAKCESIIFKGVLQLMNQPDIKIYSFKSCVIQRSVSKKKNEITISGEDHIVNVSRINDNVPKNPPFSAGYNNNLNLFVFNSVLSLIISFFFFLYYFGN